MVAQQTATVTRALAHLTPAWIIRIHSRGKCNPDRLFAGCIRAVSHVILCGTTFIPGTQRRNQAVHAAVVYLL